MASRPAFLEDIDGAWFTLKTASTSELARVDTGRRNNPQQLAGIRPQQGLRKAARRVGRWEKNATDIGDVRIGFDHAQAIQIFTSSDSNDHDGPYTCGWDDRRCEVAACDEELCKCEGQPCVVTWHPWITLFLMCFHAEAGLCPARFYTQSDGGDMCVRRHPNGCFGHWFVAWLACFEKMCAIHTIFASFLGGGPGA